MNSPGRIVLVFLLLTTVLCLLWSSTLPKRAAPLYYYSNVTLITKLLPTSVTSVPAFENQVYNNYSISNNSGRYVHGCYNKGTIGTDQLLLDGNTLKTLGCKKRAPQVVIFGARKGGTGTLRDFLSFHPQLAVADTEIHYLEYLSRTTISGRTSYATKFRYGERGNSIRITRGEAYRDNFEAMESLKTYASLMPYSTPQQLVVEKTPKYFVCKQCPILLHKMIPDCKLIAILRDPVKRAISGYAGFLQANVTKRLSNSLGMEETFEKSVIHEKGVVKRESPFIDIGIYKAHIQRWMSVFPKAQILLLDGDEFVKKPENVLQQVENFLGINASFTSEAFEFNKTKGFYCLKRPIKSCMGNKKGRKHPYVTPEVIKKLQQFYEPHNKKFSKFVNQTFSWTVYT